MIDQRFNPKDHEQRIYQRWEEAGCFKPSGDTSAQAYSVMIPPPNVTGSLHMGHALNHTVQDILCRFERMRGKNVLWQPGMDHAGIATQMVVERKLAAEGNQSRRDMGRDAFINKVWEWKSPFRNAGPNSPNAYHGKSNHHCKGRQRPSSLLLTYRHPA